MSVERDRLRQVFAGQECVFPVSVFDPISARIASMVGYEIAMLPGSVAAAVALTAPDLVLLTLTELAAQVRGITRAANLSLMVDADHGFGNALNVGRTVQELESAGASAITIEDTNLPTPFGQSAPKLISTDEMTGKLHAALSARTDPSFIIVARTISLAQESSDQAMNRIIAYSDTGVDALFLAGTPRGRDDVIAAHRATSLPLILGRTPAVLNDPSFLAENRVRVALEGQPPFRAAIQAVYEVMKSLREGNPIEQLEGRLASDEFLNTVTRKGLFDKSQNDYLAL